MGNQLVSAESIQITMVSLKIHLAFAVLACGLWMTTAAPVHTIIAPEEVKEVYLLSADDPAESATDPAESTTDPAETSTTPAPGAASSLTSTCQVLFLTIVISILL